MTPVRYMRDTNTLEFDPYRFFALCSNFLSCAFKVEANFSAINLFSIVNFLSYVSSRANSFTNT
jgi:hypothetical protein